LKPVQLPEDLIRKPITHLRDLKLGESTWINWNDMVVDSDRNCFLDPEARIHEETGLSIRVTRMETGFEVLIPRRPFQWALGEFSIREGYFPVVKLDRAADDAPA
jgi:hypothetical protein